MPDNREIVLEALLLHDKGEYADKIIKSILDKYSYLERFERGFINRVFTGTVERRLSLDFIPNHYSTVKVNKQKPVIRAILLMSTYQILFMEQIPDSAAINEAVKLAKKKRFNGLTGFVNAVLRQISRNKENIDSLFFELKCDEVKLFSAKYSCPEWLCKHYLSELGAKTTEQILINSLTDRKICARTNLSRISTDALIDKLTKEGIVCERIDGFDSFYITANEGLSNIDSFNQGLFCIQDLSSQRIVNDEVKERLKNAELVIDVCAAPGGKTCHIADMAKLLNSGLKIISRDLTDSKVEKIEENTDRCGFDNVSTCVWDALREDESLLEKADIVIADVPCSGLGVIGRKVDIKYRVQPEDFKSLSSLQKEIIDVVSKYVKKGGMLIYSTCTVNNAENSENAKWIEENLPFSLVSEEQYVNDNPDYDGFYIARFVKNQFSNGI